MNRYPLAATVARGLPFPDPALDDWRTAYHGDNYARLAAIKQAYDPDRFFDFPQAA